MRSSSDEVDVLRIVNDGERAENFWKYDVENGQQRNVRILQASLEEFDLDEYGKEPRIRLQCGTQLRDWLQRQYLTQDAHRDGDS